MEGPSADRARVRPRDLGILELAYVGDSVCELYIRLQLTLRGKRVGDMHRITVAHVNAEAQAEALGRIAPLLTREEADLVRRGRNARAHHDAPHGMDPALYARSTAFEALLGHLYITGQTDRLFRLLSVCMEDIR